MAQYCDVLLTADFDRTLTDFAGNVPARNIEAIRYFMENGGAFTVNTGRSFPYSREILEQIPINTAFLGYNGSVAMAGEELMFAHEIDLPLEQTLWRICEEFPDLNVDLHGLRMHYGFQPRGCWEDFYTERNCSHAIAQPGMDFGPFIKFNVFGLLRDGTNSQLFSGTPEEIARIDEAEQWLRATYGDKLTIYRSGARMLNVHAPNVSKIRAARELQARLGRKILICVGDAENDISMLEGADYAFCPSDGPVANRFANVCPCGDGAVADVIYNRIPAI